MDLFLLYYKPDHDILQSNNQDVINDYYIKKNILTSDDIIAKTYSLKPEYIEYIIDQSLDNLGLETIDVYYLQNPFEVCLPLLGEEKFYSKIESSFDKLEELVGKNKIKYYGISSNIAFRAKISESLLYGSLEKLYDIANKVGGNNNSFKFIQVPINIIMHEAFSSEWQIISEALKAKLNHDKDEINILKLCEYLKINVFSNSPFMQGMTLKTTPIDYNLFGSNTNSEFQLNFLKSLPFPSLKSVLCGMKQKQHLADNLNCMFKDKINIDYLFKLINSNNNKNNN